MIRDVTHLIIGSCCSGKLTSWGPPPTCEPATSSVDPSRPPSHPSEAPVVLADWPVRFNAISVRSFNVVWDMIETVERRDPRLAPKRLIPKGKTLVTQTVCSLLCRWTGEPVLAVLAKADAPLPGWHPGTSLEVRPRRRQKCAGVALRSVGGGAALHTLSTRYRA